MERRDAGNVLQRDTAGLRKTFRNGLGNGGLKGMCDAEYKKKERG